MAKKITHLIVIRSLVFFEIFVLFVYGMVFSIQGFSLMLSLIIVSVLLCCFTVQLLLIVFPAGTIVFDTDKILIKSKKYNLKVYWKDVKHIYYNSFNSALPLLDSFTLDICIRTNHGLVDIDHEIGQIKMRKREYLYMISRIPRHILEANEFMIYRTIVEKTNNPYNL